MLFVLMHVTVRQDTARNDQNTFYA